MRAQPSRASPAQPNVFSTGAPSGRGEGGSKRVRLLDLMVQHAGDDLLGRSLPSQNLVAIAGRTS
jgi:hypothetical protein